MKKLFLLLLLVNLIALVLHFVAPDEPEVVSLSLQTSVKKLQLVTERESAKQEGQANAGSASTAKSSSAENRVSDKSGLGSSRSATKDGSSDCYTLGPFNTGSELLATVVGQLGELGKLEGQRKSEERELRGYRVYVPALPTRDKALTVGKRLAAKGVKDYYVSLEKNYKNIIKMIKNHQ